MGYVRTAGMSTAARRARRRAALVLVGLFTALLLVFGISLAVVQGWIDLPGGTTTTSRSTAPVPTAAAVKPQDVVVNVYNASSVAGLAGKTADALKTRGFAVDAVDNAEEQLDSAGEIRYGAKSAAGAKLLKQSLPKLKLVNDKRTEDTVDVVLGATFKALPSGDNASSTGR